MREQDEKTMSPMIKCLFSIGIMFLVMAAVAAIGNILDLAITFGVMGSGWLAGSSFAWAMETMLK